LRLYIAKEPLRNPQPLPKKEFPGLRLETSFQRSWFERDFMTLLPRNIPARVRRRLALIFPKAEKKGRVKDWTANVENVVNAPINPVPKASLPLGLINPVYSASYIIRPSKKLPNTFTERVPICPCTGWQSRNLQIAPKKPPAPTSNILSRSLFAKGILLLPNI
jgi:hypothetical protein